VLNPEIATRNFMDSDRLPGSEAHTRSDFSASRLPPIKKGVRPLGLTPSLSFRNSNDDVDI
jgi:hypothetical protein